MTSQKSKRSVKLQIMYMQEAEIKSSAYQKVRSIMNVKGFFNLGLAAKCKQC